MYLSSQRSSTYTSAINKENMESDAELMAFIRNRLNVIGTSMYLLENFGEKDFSVRQKYINKIKCELENIRKSINEQ